MKDLEQVKEYFKYAKEVRCLADGEIFNITEKDEKGIYKADDSFWVSHKRQCLIFDGKTNQLAEILTYIFDRGEEVEVRNSEDAKWLKLKFISFNLKGCAIVEGKCLDQCAFNFIRKVTPESLLEPQLSELKKTAEANGMSVEIIFKQK